MSLPDMGLGLNGDDDALACGLHGAGCPVPLCSAHVGVDPPAVRPAASSRKPSVAPGGRSCRRDRTAPPGKLAEVHLPARRRSQGLRAEVHQFDPVGLIEDVVRHGPRPWTPVIWATTPLSDSRCWDVERGVDVDPGTQGTPANLPPLLACRTGRAVCAGSSTSRMSGLRRIAASASNSQFHTPVRDPPAAGCRDPAASVPSRSSRVSAMPTATSTLGRHPLSRGQHRGMSARPGHMPKKILRWPGAGAPSPALGAAGTTRLNRPGRIGGVGGRPALQTSDQFVRFG